jgi:hypothetical protein
VTSRFAEYDRKLGERRILVVDIERQAGLTHIFDQKTRGFISASRWTRLPSLLCLAAKWVDRKPIEFHAAWDDPAAMVEASWRLYDEADVVVGYNSVRFDNKWLRSEWRDAGMMPPRPWKDVDLYSVNRSLFGADSYSLAHLCKQLGLPSKSGHYDPVMADACMEGDEKAQRLMARYNKGDVKITEAAYLAMLPWISGHPHVTTTSGDTLTCNRCGSKDLERLPTDYTAAVLEYAQYRCGNCKGISRAGHVRRVARTRGVRT